MMAVLQENHPLLISPQECKALQDICDCNDITEEQLVSAPETIKKVEMFMYSLPRICCMPLFPNLVSLSLVQQNISVIEGLHNCPHLEVLNLAENCIQRIEGLDNCVKLRELFLYNNRIQKIKNIDHLVALETLWLANNEIRQVEGVEKCENLKELNLACNPICRLGEASNLKALEHLNVAATEIGSFKEVHKVSRLKNLKDVRFSDDHWGQCPISLLYNYETYVLSHLSNLEVLDGHIVTNEIRQTAKMTFASKRVYYNMRIKALQQNRSEIGSPSLQSVSSHINNLRRTLGRLANSRKDVWKQMLQASEFEKMMKEPVGANLDPLRRKEWWDKIENKANSLDEEISSLVEKTHSLQLLMQATKGKERATMELIIHWLLVELDTGGNVQMEIRCKTDTWFKYCVDLVVSRFSPIDFAPFGISGVQVQKVTQVYNRFLQERFQRHQEVKISQGRKSSVEYLLYGETFRGPDELLWIIEEGFPSPQEQIHPEHSSAVLLSNSIGLADIQRLKALSEELSCSKLRKSHASGWLLVVKAFVGNSILDTDGNGNAAILIESSTYPDADSVYRTHPSDPSQLSWFIMDPYLLVPEFLLEFEYSLINAMPSDNPAQQSMGDKVLPVKKPIEFLPINDRVCWNCLPLEDPVRNSLKKLQSCVSKHKFQQQLPRGITVPLSASMILRSKNMKNLSSVTHLNLHNTNISAIEPLKGLNNLKALILSFNKICKIQGLEDLQSLEVLDLSFNLIKWINGLVSLKKLINLDLAGNQISGMAQFHQISGQIQSLKRLILYGNPVEDEAGYRMMILDAFPSLEELDFISVNAEDLLPKPRLSLPYSSSHIQKNVAVGTSYLNSLDCNKDLLQMDSKNIIGGRLTDGSIDNLNNGFIPKPFNNVWNCVSNEEIKQLYNPSLESLQKHNQRYDEVEDLWMENQNLKNINFLDHFPNLRRIFFSRNSISEIHGFDKCTLLEELILDNNRIRKVEGLMHLQTLWRLDLSRNHLPSCVSISGFHALMQLSIEGNNISTLEGLSSLLSLMELYAAHNDILNIHELRHICALPKLMVVDLSGNSICTTPDYRIYSIFLLKKLKVLDGKVVLSEEASEAQEKYKGCLTRDMLEDILGHNDFNNLKTLDISGKGLKHCGIVFEDTHFHSLKELNLNDNSLISIQSLRFLSRLEVLQLENNKIGNGPLLETVPVKSPTLVNHFQSQSVLQSGGCILMSTSAIKITFQSLQILILSKNSIRSIASLQLWKTFSRLRILNLKNNKITKIDGLNGLTFLENIYLDNNCIREIGPYAFSDLHSLKELYISNNALRTAANLNCLKVLQKLDLSSNYLNSSRFCGFSCIDHFATIPRLLDLNLSNNPISQQSNYRMKVISRMRQLFLLDGNDITEEERLEAEAIANINQDSYTPEPIRAKSSTPVEGQVMSLMAASHILQGKAPLKATPFDFEISGSTGIAFSSLHATNRGQGQGGFSRSWDLRDRPCGGK